MTVLQGFIMVPERTPITSDGHPSENAGLNCVPASLCAGAMYLNGISQTGGKYTPDSFKDAVYGQGYVGGTSAVKFVDYCALLGIRLYALNGNGTELVQHAHEHLRAGHPVVFTEPNPYGNPDYTHVCVFFGESSGYLTCMDPWIAQAITRRDAEWATILLDNQIWIEERLMIDLNNPVVAGYFSLQSNGWWLSTHTKTSSGQPIYIHGEILTHYRACGETVLRGLEVLGLPVSNEVPEQGFPGCTRQYFERGVLRFDPNHAIDGPPAAGRVYHAHLYSGSAQDPKIAELEAELAAAKQPAGIDKEVVANFQTARAIQAHQITQASQALETALVQPL